MIKLRENYKNQIYQVKFGTKAELANQMTHTLNYDWTTAISNVFTGLRSREYIFVDILNIWFRYCKMQRACFL